jgi:hypothetical protein
MAKFIANYVNLKTIPDNDKAIMKKIIDKATEDPKIAAELIKKLSLEKKFNEMSAVVEKLLGKDAIYVLVEIFSDDRFKINSNIRDFAIKIINKSLDISKVNNNGDALLRIIRINIGAEKIFTGVVRRGKQNIAGQGKDYAQEIIEAILKNNNTKRFDKLIHFIVMGKDDEATKLAKDPKTEINGFGKINPLLFAIEKNKKDLVKLILEHKNEKGESDTNIGVTTIESLNTDFGPTDFELNILEAALASRNTDIEIIKHILSYKGINLDISKLKEYDESSREYGDKSVLTPERVKLLKEKGVKVD